MNVISSEPRLGAPFPGLRPFKSDEDAIFFGRHEQVSDMLQRLERAGCLRWSGRADAVSRHWYAPACCRPCMKAFFAEPVPIGRW